MDYGLKARGYLQEASWLLFETTKELEKKHTELTDKQRSILKVIRSKIFTARCFVDLARKRPIATHNFFKLKNRMKRHVKRRLGVL